MSGGGKQLRGIRLAPIVSVGLLWGIVVCSAQKPETTAETAIAALSEGLAEVAGERSSVEVRRACKRVIRAAEALREAAPGAPNRYALLAVLFRAQKRLLTVENTERNRVAIFETCRLLSDAPDAYAEARFEADMLLSEKELAKSEATVAERTAALEDMLARYRGTPAEWKSLMVGSLIATKLLDFDLQKRIADTMDERFAGGHQAIQFRRKQSRGGQLDTIFTGRYKTADGGVIVFPDDRLGHNVLLYFWSRNTPDIDEYLSAVKRVQLKSRKPFEVYSLNVDELPDAGRKKLRELGLDWTALQLPGGRDSSTYRAYAQRDPDAVLVNAQGHALLVSSPEKMGVLAVEGIRRGVLGGWNVPQLEKRIDNTRYLAQLRYLFNGDFLVGWGADGGRQPKTPDKQQSGPGATTDVPPATLGAIDACFEQPPDRYRLTAAESLARYRKAERLCREAIGKHAAAQGLWRVRDRRTVALLGMWNLGRGPAHLEAAVKEARAVLAGDPPQAAELVARFCLARHALRAGAADPEVLLPGFIDDAGGDEAPAAALAAAAILAIEANARSLHEQYRQRLLDVEGDGEPSLWPVYAFLRDKHHRYRNFWASPGGHGYGRPQKYKYRHMVSGLAETAGDRDRRIAIELKKLDGKILEIPKDTAGDVLGVVFAEPPATASARSNWMSRVSSFASAYVSCGVKVVVAFISDDADTARALTRNSRVEFQPTILPDGLTNPLVRKLGILSADRIPNLLLLRRDGTIAWTLSGLEYQAFRYSEGYAVELAIRNNIEKVRSDAGVEALEDGDYKRALTLFDEFEPGHARRDYWAAARLHGRALAHVGLRQWEAALTEIDKAIAKRRDNFKSAMCKCHGVVEMLLTKATILEKLDRQREENQARREAAAENLPHSKLPPGLARQGVPVGVYYDWLKQIRLGMEEGK